VATRRERVVLELEDAFTAGVIRAAAASELLDKRLDSLDRSIASTGKTAGGSTREIDRYSGRFRLLMDLATIGAPALVTIGAVGIPAVTGLASALGMAALSGGTAILAFQGVGTALGALNKAHLQPTAANLEAADLALRQLGPDAQSLVRHLSSLTDEWHKLRDAAGSGILPGTEQALDSLLTRGPQAIQILEKISDATGQMIAEGAESLASERWDDFFDFIETEAPAAIVGLAHATGSLAHAAAELWMGFGPLNDDFLGWLVRGTRLIDEWATGLDQTEGFQEFVAYIRTNGPQVGETLGSIAMALLHIIEAAAPLGGPTLQLLEAVADVVSIIADSPFGPPIMAGVAALALFNRTLAITEALGKRAWLRAISGANTLTGKVQFAVGALIALEAAGLAIDTLEARAAGAAPSVERLTAALIAANEADFNSQFGATIADALDALDQDGIDGVTQDLDNLANKAGVAGDALAGGLATMIGQGGRLAEVGIETREASEAFESLDAALTGLVASGGPERAQQAFDSLAASQGLTADQQRILLSLLPDFQGALQGAANAAALASEDVDDVAHSAGRATTAFEVFAHAVARANRLLSDRATMRDYEAAIDDARKALEENGKTLDINTEKGRANQAALDDIADTAVKVAGTLKGADRNDYLKQARKAFIDTATQMGLARGEAIKLANQLGLIPPIDIANQNALKNIREVSVALQGLNDKTIYVTTVMRAEHQDIRLGEPRAHGGPVTAGKPYVVGERRPELFVPRTNGTILPRVPGSDSGSDGFGSDTNGLLGKILDALMGSSFGAGQMRAFMKAVDEIQRGVSKNKGKWNDDLRDQAHDLLKEIREAEKDRNRAIREAFRSLEADLEQGAAAIRTELHDLKRDLRDAGGVWNDALRKHASRILELAREYDRQAATLQRQQEVLDGLIDTGEQLRSAQASFVEQVRANFTHDLFGNGLEGFFLQAGADTNDASAFDAVLAQLAAMGLDGAAFQALAASGDLATAQELAASGLIDAFEQAIAARESALSALGGNAGDQAFGEQLRINNEQVMLQNRLIGQTETTMQGLQASVDRQEKLLKDLAGLPDKVGKQSYRGTYGGAKDALSGRDAAVAAGSR